MIWHGFSWPDSSQNWPLTVDWNTWLSKCITDMYLLSISHASNTYLKRDLHNMTFNILNDVSNVERVHNGFSLTSISKYFDQFSTNSNILDFAYKTFVVLQSIKLLFLYSPQTHLHASCPAFANTKNCIYLMCIFDIYNPSAATCTTEKLNAIIQQLISWFRCYYNIL